MQGPIENALMLVAAGNAWLAGKDIGAFWPEADTFRYVGLCEFRTHTSKCYPWWAPERSKHCSSICSSETFRRRDRTCISWLPNTHPT